MGVTFTTPLLLLLWPVLVVLAFFAARNAPLRLRRRNRRLSLVLRAIIFALMVGALAGAQVVRTSDRLAVAFLIDGSDSMSPAGKAQAMAFTQQSLAKMGDKQEAGVIVFGENALVEKLVGADKTLAALESAPIPTYTNIAEAVRLGTALLPADANRRLVLISDGNQNIADVRDAARIAAANGVQVDVVPIERQGGPEVSLENLDAPPNLRQGEEFDLKISIESTVATAAQLVIAENGVPVADEAVQLKVGLNQFVRKMKTGAQGIAVYNARVIVPGGKDTLAQNNEYSAFSQVKGKPRVLVVEGHTGEALSISRALAATDVESSLVTPQAFPGLTDLSQYDSVVMVNVPANLMNPAALQTLQTFVRDLGKGMVMIGGDESYGLGGYFRTPIEAMLPVDLQLPNKLNTPNTALVLVIDRSGSMNAGNSDSSATAGGIPKIELAKDAAVDAASQLSATDKVGVVTFDTDAQWVVPLAPLSNPTDLAGPIGRIAPGGGTHIDAGLQMAVEGLVGVEAKTKHIILLTDGATEGGDYDKLLALANKSGITISTVGLGKDVNTEFLQDKATRGGGRYYFVDDPSALPQLFTKETHLASRNYIVEGKFTPALAAPSPILKDVAANGLPSLKGYIGTHARPTSTVALVSDKGDPILAHWQYGLGRVVAWTSDSGGKWAADWAVWNGYGPFWAQATRWTVAENPGGSLQIRTQQSGNRMLIEADAITPGGTYLNNLDARASIVNPRNDRDEMSLRQTAPGHYEGIFTPTGAGTYLINVKGTNPAQPDQTVSKVIGAVVPYSPEYKQLGLNIGLLKEIAVQTGGRVLSEPAAAFTDDVHRTTRNEDIWQWLVLMAALLLPFDIAARRINLSFAWLRRSSIGARGLAQSRTRARPATDPAVSRLMQAKERAGRTLIEQTVELHVSSPDAPPIRNEPTSVAEVVAPRRDPSVAEMTTPRHDPQPIKEISVQQKRSAPAPARAITRPQVATTPGDDGQGTTSRLLRAKQKARAAQRQPEGDQKEP